jgi:division protein CdvB (Snf7/Vps24/ESCRT-III family)
MASLDSLRIFRRGKGGGGGGDYKGKIAIALREIEGQRKELDLLKVRLTERRQKLFEIAVRSLGEKNKAKAAVYATEHAEVRKVFRVVEASELALTQVSLRLQSITEIGDAMFHMDTAFKSLRHVSKEMQGVIPAFDAASTEINSTLAETMAQMGQISPNINIDIRTEGSEELVAQARRYAEEQKAHLMDSLRVPAGRYEEHLLRTADGDDDELSSQQQQQQAVLASGEDSEGDAEAENLILGTLYSSPQDDSSVDYEVARYAATHEGALDISKTSEQLGIPQDEVEESMIHLVAQGKVKPSQTYGNGE